MILFLLRYHAKYFGDENSESYKFLVSKETFSGAAKRENLVLSNELTKVELSP